MPLFHFIGLDRKGAREKRMEVRPEHLAYASGHARLGGALLDADGLPIGSVMIVEADNIEEAHLMMSNDPYTKADIFEATELRPWRIAIGGIEGYQA
jgi:uncharacterized protein YciI